MTETTSAGAFILSIFKEILPPEESEDDVTTLFFEHPIANNMIKKNEIIIDDFIDYPAKNTINKYFENLAKL